MRLRIEGLTQASWRRCATVNSNAGKGALVRREEVWQHAWMFELDGIDHVALAVSNPERSANWYVDVLGFERQHDDVWKGRPIFLAKGNTGIALFPAPCDARLVGSNPDHIGMTHFAFRARDAEFLSAQHDLKSRGINFELRDHKISHSIYFSDPDGIRLEITTYEVDDAKLNKKEQL